MTALQKFFSFFFPTEPKFGDTEFRLFEDSLGNFQIFYPKHWEYEKETAVIDGTYAIIFYSCTSPTNMRIEVNTRIPKKFGKKSFQKCVKDEIEKPTAAVISKARNLKVNGRDCVETEYSFSDNNRKMHGKKLFIFANDRIINIFFICLESDYAKLKKTFAYIIDSLVIKSKKMMFL